MICSKCGSENVETAKFCNECGTKLETSDINSLEEQSDATLDHSAQVQDAALTAALDIPPVFRDDGNAASFNSSDEFDFSPIGSNESSDLQDRDVRGDDERGFEEYLVDSGYEPPQNSWKSGDTMEMPRIEGDEAPKQTEFRAPAEKKKMSKRRLISMIVVIAVVILALGVAAVTYQMEIWGGKSVPDVVGMNEADASEILEDQGFIVKTMEVKSDDTEDIVLLMDPTSGRRLSEGSEVVLQIATPRVIPEIKGVSLEDLKEYISIEGFEKVEYIKVKSDEAENTILSIEPVSGTKAQASTQIKVSVAEPYTVPDVIGKERASAIELMQNEGFVVEEYYIYSDAVENTIVATDPVAGTKLSSNSTVVLSVAKSLSAELIATTEEYLASVGVLSFDGTSYEIISYDSVTYLGDNTTQAVVTVVGVTTLGDGETVRGSTKQRTITFTWSEPHTDPISYY